MQENYLDLLNIFNYYSGKSDYPVISYNDITAFAHECNILNPDYVKLADLDLLVIATNVVNHSYRKSEERNFERYELLEFIVRLGIFRYYESGIVKDQCKAVERCLDELIYPNAKKMDGDHFRMYYCYNVKTNEILAKNSVQIKKLYDHFTHPQKKWVTLEDCKGFVRKLNFNVSELIVGAIYAESMMTIIDTIRDTLRVNQMKYVEFLIFLCRITHEHYQKSPYKKEPLSNKLDHKIDDYLAFVHQEPIFKLGELFQAERQMAIKLYKRKKRQLMRQAKIEAGGGPAVSNRL